MSLAGFKAQNHPQQTGKRGARDDVDDRGTDQAFFEALSERTGGFTLDVAAAPHNAKCERYYTINDDGLAQSWSQGHWETRGARVWCNPPYSDIRPWVQKAWDEWLADHGVQLIVMLLPANRVEQGWWQDLVETRRDRPGSPLRVEFLRGRMRFDRPGWTKPAKGDRPPFGCCLLIWGAASERERGQCRFCGDGIQRPGRSGDPGLWEHDHPRIIHHAVPAPVPHTPPEVEHAHHERQGTT